MGNLKNSIKLICNLICITIFTNIATAQTTVATFHNISIYWSPQKGGFANQVLVTYRKTGASNWEQALPIKYNPILEAGNDANGQRNDIADYRGTIANLTPNTSYEIKLTLENTTETITISANTWNEVFPTGTITTPATTDYVNNRFKIYVNQSGTPTAYHVFDGQGMTIDAHYTSSGGGNFNEALSIYNAEYIIIRNFKFKNGGKYGIYLSNCNHIIIEDCEITNWGSKETIGDFGNKTQGGVYTDGGLKNCVFQRNKVHSPRYSANSWAELHNPNGEANDDNYHPNGPQAIFINNPGNNMVENNVFRYNEFYSTSTSTVNGNTVINHFDDVIGGATNSSYFGFLGADSDIYGNYIADSYDDGIEVEGGNRNVRVWNNYIENVYVGIGNAPSSIGPLYIWRNVLGKSYSPINSRFGEYGNFIKMGTAGFGNTAALTNGYIYIFNNTILQPNNIGAGGIGTRKNIDGTASNRIIRHCITRNNILQVKDATVVNSISKRNTGSCNPNFDVDYDYDLLNGDYPKGYEINGLVGIPTYANTTPLFNFTTKTGDFTLTPTSLGFDNGVIIPNFITQYNGTAPDMGAHEHGTNSLIYGLGAEANTANINNFNIHNISIFPIPTNKLLHVNNINNTKINKIQIFSTNGKLVFKQKLNQNNNTLNLEKLNKGIYFLKIRDTSNNIIQNIKLIID